MRFIIGDRVQIKDTVPLIMGEIWIPMDSKCWAIDGERFNIGAEKFMPVKCKGCSFYWICSDINEVRRK